MTYLIVGVDRRTLDGWHRNVMAQDARSACRLAHLRAAGEGVALVVAAVIGPGWEVLPEPSFASSSRAARTPSDRRPASRSSAKPLPVAKRA